MTATFDIRFSRVYSNQVTLDADTVTGHCKSVADAVNINNFGKAEATVWFSVKNDKGVVAATVEDINYYSESTRAGGWVNVMKAAVRTMQELSEVKTEDLVAVSLSFDVVNDDLLQFRVIYTWTPTEVLAGYCTAQSWEWEWLESRSNTAAEIQRLIFTTKEEETSGT